MFWFDPAPHDVPSSEDVASQAAPAVNMRLRPARPQQIRSQIPAHQFISEFSRHRALSDQIDWIGELRIAKTDTADPAGFDPEMNAAQRVQRDDAPIAAHLAGKINIFLPAIKDEPLVKS